MVLSLAVVTALAAAARAEPDAYDWARLRHQPVTVASLSVIAEQPSRFLTQAVELSGRVTGVLRGEVVATILLRLDSGETVQLIARPEHEMVGVGLGALALGRLTEPPAEDFTFHLLGMKEATAQPPHADAEQAHAELAAKQSAQANAAGVVPAQPRYVLSSRGGPPPPSQDRIIAAYADTIAYFNPRLEERERYTIARYIIDFSQRIGVDARLVMAVVAVESSFNPAATSRKGAMGLGQLMPATARGMGVENAYDPEENLWAAIRVVRGHLERNDGDLALALACYNAGSGAVRRYGGVPPYRETQNYIRKVINIYLQFAPEMAG